MTYNVFSGMLNPTHSLTLLYEFYFKKKSTRYLKTGDKWYNSNFGLFCRLVIVNRMYLCLLQNKNQIDCENELKLQPLHI